VSPDASTRRITWLTRGMLALIFLVYVSGYGWVRSVHYVVHTTAYVGGHDPDGPVVAEHGMAPGDFGAPLLGPVTTLLTLVASLLYWPMTRVELVYWNIAQPAGSPYDGRVDPPPNWDAFPPATPPEEVTPVATPP